MPDVEKICSALSRIPAFAGLTLVRHRQILERIGLRKLAPGEVIFSEGDAPGPIYLIKRGEIEIVRIRGLLAEPVAYLKAGDVFGELGTLGEKSRNATARAFTEAAVFEIAREDALLLAKDIEPFQLLLAARFLDRTRKNQHYGVEGGRDGASVYREKREDFADED